MTATHTTNSTVSNAPVLYLALDLGTRDWMLAFTVGLGQPPRLKTIKARNTTVLLDQIKAAKKRFGLPEDAPVLACYEAGRDGFWLHRFLLAQGVQNLVVDSSSIEVNRRQRRAKSDRLNGRPCERFQLRHDSGRHGCGSLSFQPFDRRVFRFGVHRLAFKGSIGNAWNRPAVAFNVRQSPLQSAHWEFFFWA